MPALITERWTEYRYKHGESAARAFDITGVADAGAARAALAAAPWSISKGVAFNLDTRLKAEEPDLGIFAPASRGYRALVQFLRPAGGESDNDPDDPLDKEVKYKIEFAESTESYDRDADGVPVRNTALSPFESDDARETSDIFLTYVRNVSSYPLALAIACNNRSNLDAFFFPNVGTVQAGQALCKGIHLLSDYAGSSTHVTIATRFKLREDGFRSRHLDAGYEGWYSSGGTQPGLITTAPHDPKSPDSLPKRPVLLDGSGRPRDVNKWKVHGNLPISPAYTWPDGYIEAGTDATWLRFKRYPFIAFTPLNAVIL